MRRIEEASARSACLEPSRPASRGRRAIRPRQHGDDAEATDRRRSSGRGSSVTSSQLNVTAALSCHSIGARDRRRSAASMSAARPAVARRRKRVGRLSLGRRPGSDDADVAARPPERRPASPADRTAGRRSQHGSPAGSGRGELDRCRGSMLVATARRSPSRSADQAAAARPWARRSELRRTARSPPTSERSSAARRRPCRRSAASGVGASAMRSDATEATRRAETAAILAGDARHALEVPADRARADHHDRIVGGSDPLEGHRDRAAAAEAQRRQAVAALAAPQLVEQGRDDPRAARRRSGGRARSRRR